MRKALWTVLGITVLVGLGVFTFHADAPAIEDMPTKNTASFTEYKNTTYTIEGTRVTLTDGSAETPAAPDSATMVRTQYFGNELKTDLNGDGREDVAFILTQNSGGSGTFYYAVAALNTPHGYIGSDAFFLGDRVAPQSVTVSPDQSQRYVVVFNYADRAADEPMTAQPSVGKSAYLKLDPDTMQWAIVLSPEERQSL